MNKKPPYNVCFMTLTDLIKQHNEVVNGCSWNERAKDYRTTLEVVLLDMIKDEMGSLLAEVKQRLAYLDDQV